MSNHFRTPFIQVMSVRLQEELFHYDRCYPALIPLEKGVDCHDKFKTYNRLFVCPKRDISICPKWPENSFATANA